MRKSIGNDLKLGMIPGRGAMLPMTASARATHLYCCGSTGSGKSKLLEYLLRQDIISWRRSKCAVILLDPHGSLYDGLINWLAWNKIERPVVPIDLRYDDWIVSYNLLRQRPADPAVLVDNLTDAMAYVWGQGGTDKTPLFARWVGNVIRTLYEKKLTLVEADHLLDHVERQVRAAITTDLKDKPSRRAWQLADTFSPRDFEMQVGSTINRLERFIRNQSMRTIFGQAGPSLDMGRALDEGWIILVSLATEGAKISRENAELFATMLLADLWVAAMERGKRQGVKPAYVYIDEFQRFVTPTIADNLDEARGFGIHLTAAHQFPNQLRDRGENGIRVYNSIMENATSKIVFRLSHQDNLEAMAQWLFRGTMNPDLIKHELFSTKVMEFREEMRRSYTHSEITSTGGGQFTGTTAGLGQGGYVFGGGQPVSWSDSMAESAGDSETFTQSATEGESVAPVLIPIMGKELSHVQFRSLEEQLFRAMAVLFDQKERQAVTRLIGMSAPVSMYTPTVTQFPTSEQMRNDYLDRCYGQWPFALRGNLARKRIEEREVSLVKELLKQTLDEPETALIKRRKRSQPPEES